MSFSVRCVIHEYSGRAGVGLHPIPWNYPLPGVILKMRGTFRRVNPKLKLSKLPRKIVKLPLQESILFLQLNHLGMKFLLQIRDKIIDFLFKAVAQNQIECAILESAELNVRYAPLNHIVFGFL